MTAQGSYWVAVPWALGCSGSRDSLGLPWAPLFSQEGVRLPRAPRRQSPGGPQQGMPLKGPERVRGLRRTARQGWVRTCVCGPGCQGPAGARCAASALCPVLTLEPGRWVQGGGSEALQVLLCGEFHRRLQNEKTRERTCPVRGAGRCFRFSVERGRRVPFLPEEGGVGGIPQISLNLIKSGRGSDAGAHLGAAG